MKKSQRTYLGRFRQVQETVILQGRYCNANHFPVHLKPPKFYPTSLVKRSSFTDVFWKGGRRTPGSWAPGLPQGGVSVGIGRRLRFERLLQYGWREGVCRCEGDTDRGCYSANVATNGSQGRLPFSTVALCFFKPAMCMHLTSYGASGEGTRESEFGIELVLIIHAIETGVEEETRDEGISRTEGHQGEHGEETHIIVVEKPAALVSTFDHDAGYKREGTEGRVVAGETQHGILPAFPLVLAALSKQDAVNDFLSSRSHRSLVGGEVRRREYFRGNFTSSGRAHASGSTFL